MASDPFWPVSLHSKKDFFSVFMASARSLHTVDRSKRWIVIVVHGCQFVDSHKSTGSGPVRSPARCNCEFRCYWKCSFSFKARCCEPKPPKNPPASFSGLLRPICESWRSGSLAIWCFCRCVSLFLCFCCAPLWVWVGSAVSVLVFVSCWLPVCCCFPSPHGLVPFGALVQFLCWYLPHLVAAVTA